MGGGCGKRLTYFRNSALPVLSRSDIVKKWKTYKPFLDDDILDKDGILKLTHDALQTHKEVL